MWIDVAIRRLGNVIRHGFVVSLSHSQSLLGTANKSSRKIQYDMALANSTPMANANETEVQNQAINPEAASLAAPILIERQTSAPDTSGRYLYYPGAKETILDVVLRLVPHDAIRLIEPFTGSGALASGLAFRFKEIEASDLNAELIESHKRAIGDTESFLATLDKLFGSIANDQKWFYDTIRDGFNASDNLAAKAAFLVFMNRKGFKGLMRRNSKGEFNVPFWEERADEPMPESQVREFSERLGGKTTFSTRDFRKALEGAGKGDFCYLDPPYLAEQGKADTFAEYIGAFGLEDHKDMAKLCRQAADRGATVVVSNHDSDLVRMTYGSADRIYALAVPRGMSDATGKGDSSAREILAVWLPSSAWFQAFVRKPSLGEKPDPFHHWADQATLDRKVFKIAKNNGWLVEGADADHISFRSFAENGRCLLSIARLGTPILRRLALEKPGREKHLSLHLLTNLMVTDSTFPPAYLLPEKEAAAILLDLAKRLEKALAEHPLRDKALTRILKSKAEIYVSRKNEGDNLPVKRLPDRYLALLNAVVARKWGFDSEPCQRLLLYAELCEDKGSNNFIRFCEAVEAGSLSSKSLLAAMPAIKIGHGKGLGIKGHELIPASKIRKIFSSINLS